MDGLKTVRHTVDFGEPAGREDFDVYSRYQELQPLGAGGFGFVASAVDTEALDASEEQVVIKKLPTIFKSPALTKAGLREVACLLFFVHDNILSLRDIILPLAEDENGEPFFDRQQMEYRGLYLVLERMTCDLGHLIYADMDLPVDIRRLIIYQLLRGMKCIHSARVLHRDLKPQNILVNEDCDVKICDFGLAREYGSEGMTTLVATQFYRAPELLLEMSRDEEGDEASSTNTVYSEAVDVWSVGCIMAELILRRPLFHCPVAAPARQIATIFGLLGRPAAAEAGAEELRAFLAAFPGDPQPSRAWEDILPPERSDPLERDLISRMVVFEPSKRISIAEAMKHPFLAELHDPDDEPDAPCQYTFEIKHQEEPYLDLLDHFASMHPEARSLPGWPQPVVRARRSSSVSTLASTLTLSHKPSFSLSTLQSLRHAKWQSVRMQFADVAHGSFRRLPGMLDRSVFRNRPPPGLGIGHPHGHPLGRPRLLGSDAPSSELEAGEDWPAGMSPRSNPESWDSKDPAFSPDASPRPVRLRRRSSASSDFAAEIAFSSDVQCAWLEDSSVYQVTPAALLLSSGSSDAALSPPALAGACAALTPSPRRLTAALARTQVVVTPPSPCHRLPPIAALGLEDDPGWAPAPEPDPGPAPAVP
eukprot:EG_transcript_6065